MFVVVNFDALAQRSLEPSRFESCIQQRKTTCLLSIRTSLACARSSKLTTNMYIARARCESQPAVKSSGLNAHSSQGWAIEFKFLAWSSIAQSVCEWAFSLLANRCLETSRFEACIQHIQYIHTFTVGANEWLYAGALVFVHLIDACSIVFAWVTSTFINLWNDLIIVFNLVLMHVHMQLLTSIVFLKHRHRGFLYQWRLVKPALRSVYG